MVNSIWVGCSLWPCRLGQPWTPWSGSGRQSAPGFSPWRRSKSCHRRRWSCWCFPSAAQSQQNLPLYTHKQHTHRSTCPNTDLLATTEVSPWKLKMELLSMIELPQLSQLELQCSAIFFMWFSFSRSISFCCNSKTSDEAKMCKTAMRFGPCSILL